MKRIWGKKTWLVIALIFLVTGIAPDPAVSAESKYTETAGAYGVVSQDSKISISKTAPEIKLEKWGEVSLTLTHGVSGQVGPKSLSKKGELEWVGLKKNVVVYPLEATIQMDGGGVEVEVILKEKPTSNVISFSITTQGLDFFYQPELTVDEKARGNIRPDNVVGSYAVYHKTKTNHRAGQTNYKTGKAFHIYRPKIIDNRGGWVWGKLNINKALGLLTIIVPQAFLDTAVYPVIVDPTFGYTTAGASSGAVGNNEIYASGMGAPGSNGTTDSLSIYCANSTAGNDVEVGLYADDGSPGPGSLISGSPVEELDVGTWSAEWHVFTMSGLSVVGSTNYWPAATSDSDMTVYYDSVAGTNRYWDSHTYGNAWPVTHAQDSSSGAKYSMYVTYTVSGGAPAKGAIFYPNDIGALIFGGQIIQ